jgi:2-polyprenyl-3-methyl-5-hydroxy-6-metoxy-1,4-benzoquinol methylase
MGVSLVTRIGKVKHLIRRLVGERAYSKLRNRRIWLGRTAQRIVYGGPTRERVLISLLGSHYRNRFRREWLYSLEQPHFYSHRMGWFRLGFEDDDGGGSVYARAFYSSEVIRPGDIVLDIGCGDGFISKRFLAERAGRVDAIDIEPSAIREARRSNHKSNVRYLELDATRHPFPAKRYDVIVWDGALGHFDPTSTSSMLTKVADGMKPDGLFVGSESLGPEGTDHLQHWESLTELRTLLERFFHYVELKELSIVIGRQGQQFVRREAYWRCAMDRERLRALPWQHAEPGES